MLPIHSIVDKGARKAGLTGGRYPSWDVHELMGRPGG